MGVGKLVLARNEGVKVVELKWALANGAKARMYTRQPLLHLLEKKPLLVENMKAIQDTKEYIKDHKLNVKILQQKLQIKVTANKKQVGKPQFKELKNNLLIAQNKIPELEDKLKNLEEEKIRLENMPLGSKDWKRVKMLTTKARPLHKIWTIETNNGSTVYKKGDILILNMLKPHTKWLKGGINYSRHRVFRKQRRRICIVQSVNYDEQTLKLLTDDHFLLNSVPMKHVRSFLPLLGTCVCLKFQTDSGSVGYSVIGSSVNKEKGDKKIIRRSPLCPMFHNNKKDKSLSFVVLCETNLYKSRKMEEVMEVLRRGEIIKLTNEIEEGNASKINVANSIAASSVIMETTKPCNYLTARILGHSGEWRDESKDAWCNRPSKKSGIKNEFHPICCHGIAIIPKPHWSCCGVTERYYPCRKPSGGKLNSLCINDAVLATPWSLNNLNKYASEVKDADWLPGTLLKNTMMELLTYVSIST